jgi:hypothetical protein
MTGVSRPAILSTLQRTLLALVLFGLNTWGIYTAFTSRGQIAVWDFHPRWLGLRAMLRDGADPYSDEVTLDIQLQMLGRPARPDEDQQAFAYPLHVMALMGPLALLPLPMAQALWLSLLEAGLLIFIFVAPRAVGWRPPLWLSGLTALFVVGLYSTVWAVILGQISIIVAVLVALAWWGMRAKRLALAGICLALATVKPQMVFLLVSGLLAHAVYHRRWQLVASLALAFSVLVLLPVPWLPTWPLAWFVAAGRYASYTDFESTLTMLTRSTWLANIVAALLVVWTLDRWWRAPERWAAASDWALGMLIAISALAAPRTTHVNQLILLLPLFLVFRQLGKPGIVAVVEIGLLVGLWVMDLLLSPSINSPEHMVWQHRFISPILPVGLMLALLYISRRAVREMD